LFGHAHAQGDGPAQREGQVAAFGDAATCWS
jgi:hypothetical protein